MIFGIVLQALQKVKKDALSHYRNVINKPWCWSYKFNGHVQTYRRYLHNYYIWSLQPIIRFFVELMRYHVVYLYLCYTIFQIKPSISVAQNVKVSFYINAISSNHIRAHVIGIYLFYVPTPKNRNLNLHGALRSSN